MADDEVVVLSTPAVTSPVDTMSPASSVGFSDRSTSPSPSDGRRKWSSPITTSVRSLFRRRGSSGACDVLVTSPLHLAPASVFYLWNTLPESVRFHVVEFVDLRDICAFGEVSVEAFEFSRSGSLLGEKKTVCLCSGCHPGTLPRDAASATFGNLLFAVADASLFGRLHRGVAGRRALVRPGPGWRALKVERVRGPFFVVLELPSAPDVLWKRLFMDRFHACASAHDVQHSFLAEYKDRLCQPCVGDLVQVVWEGSFNLITDTLASYSGRAWWEAEVVERQADCSMFKIHYPHWDANTWDEWVPRERIRWPPAEDEMKVRFRWRVFSCSPALPSP
jgi:hypothetical protein